MTAIDVTAVIPTYNRAHLLPRCLDAVLAQTAPPRHVLVVDDGSTDDTVATLERDYSDAVEVVRGAHAGASAARNLGVERAVTTWIAPCDSDDIWEPDHLERLGAAVVATDGRAALYFDDTAIPSADGGGTFFGVAGLDLHAPEVAEPPVEWLHRRLQPMLLQSSMIRRSIWQELGGLDERLRTRHDTHLFYRIGFRHPMCAVPGVGVHLLDDAGDASRLTGVNGQASSGFWTESLTMHRDLLAIAPDPDSRARLRRHVSGDHLQLSGRAVRDRAMTVAVRHGAQAVATSPTTVASLLGRGLRRRLRGDARRTARIPR